MSSQEINQFQLYPGIDLDRGEFQLFQYRGEDGESAHRKKTRTTRIIFKECEIESNPLSNYNESNANSSLQKHIAYSINLSENSFPQFPESNNFESSSFHRLEDINPIFDNEQAVNKHQIDEKWIFEQKMEKTAAKVNKKNTVHYLVRLAVNSFIERIDSESGISENLREKFMEECERIKARMESRQQQNYILKDLSSFLTNDAEFGQEGSRLSRRIFQKILSQKYLEAVQNSQMTKQVRLKFMVNCKVYGLRCRNSKLVLKNKY